MLGVLLSLDAMTPNAEREAARRLVADYHEKQLGRLVERAGEAIDRYRAGDLDPFEVDRALFQYSRAAKELWKFCNLGGIEISALILRSDHSDDWWERAEPRPRRS